MVLRTHWPCLVAFYSDSSWSGVTGEHPLPGLQCFSWGMCYSFASSRRSPIPQGEAKLGKRGRLCKTLLLVGTKPAVRLYPPPPPNAVEKRNPLVRGISPVLEGGIATEKLYPGHYLAHLILLFYYPANKKNSNTTARHIYIYHHVHFI